MKICTTIDDVRQTRTSLNTVGFVPTMGFLHEGHLSLVRRARAENDAVAVSIFVNPTQFGPDEDFESYPRDPERDLASLRHEGVDLVFIPDAQTLYPPGFVTRVEVGGVADQMEGHSRPGHFSGVATVVSKLFSIIQPQRAYFGQKDAQQSAVVQRLVADLNLPVDVVVVPTSREADGLARSSRNVRLTDEERARAPALFQALQAAESLFCAGERDCNHLEHVMTAVLHRAGQKAIDYAVIVDPATFERITPVTEDALALLAVPMGKVRLIDNLPLGNKQSGT